MKVAYQDDVRMVEVESYADLLDASYMAFTDGVTTTPAVFTYLDADDDRITIGHDTDLALAFSDVVSRSGTLRVEMRLTTPNVIAHGGVPHIQQVR